MSIINKLYNRIQEYYVPGHISGLVQLVINDKTELNCYFNFLDKITINQGEIKNYDTRISLSQEILEKILQYPETFDPRDISFTGNIIIEGNLKLMHYFTQLLKRPAQIVLDTLEQIRSKEYKRINQVIRNNKLSKKIILDSIVNSYPIHGINVLKS